MKVKAGSGNPMSTNRLQSLQTQLFSLKKKYFLINSTLRYENGSDWSLWNSMEPFGVPAAEFAKTTALIEMYDRYKVSAQCRIGLRKALSFGVTAGLICVCGHPEIVHTESRLCEAGTEVCYCPKFSKALRVSDINFFFKASKGPHEGHALVLGVNLLHRSGGTSSQLVAWQCTIGECNRTKNVNPARVSKGNKFTAGATVHERHKLVCEVCLFTGLNGSYFSG